MINKKGVRRVKKKQISEMNTDEILRQQLELLAEKSRKTKSINELEKLTNAMISICKLFYSECP